MADDSNTLNMRKAPLEIADGPVGPWPLRMAGLLLVLAFMVQLYYYGAATQSPPGALCLWWQQGCSNDQQPRLSPTALQSIKLIKGEVQRHPTVTNALLIDATIINRGPQPQRYPGLEVQFFNLAGHSKAARRFQPTEYLPDSAAITAGMPPGEPTAVRLEVIDPGLPVLSFQFNLY